MANSEVLLVKPVEGLGGEGDQVKVRAGYARNFLLPRQIAVPLSASNRKHVDSLKKRRAEREQTELTGAQDVAKKLEKTSLAFAVKTGEGGRMFGAITAQDVHDKLVASGLEIDKRKIHLFTPVKTLGKHTVKIKLHTDVSVELGFDPEHLLLFDVNAAQAGRSPSETASFYADLRRRLSEAPGVRDATLAHASLIAAGVVTNVLALGSRALPKLLGFDLAGARPFDSWWLQASITYTLSGVVAGLLGAFCWFQFNDRNGQGTPLRRSGRQGSET